MSSVGELMVKASEHHNAGELAQAVELYQEALQRESNHADANHLLGLALYQLGQAEDGIAHMKRGIELKPNDPGFLSNCGSALKSIGQIEQSIEFFEEATRLAPDFLPALYNVGEAYCLLERFDEGERAYRRAGEVKPEVPEIWSNLGICLAKADKWEEGLEAFGAALALDAANAAAHFGMGHVCQKLERLEAAENSYTQARRCGYPEAECCARLGDVNMSRGLYERALEHFEKALSLGHAPHSLYNSLALTYQGLGRTEDALEAVNAALEKEPISPDALSTKAGLLNESARFEEAVRLANKSIFFDQESEVAYNHLGNGYKGMTRLEDAKEAFETCLQLNPLSAGSHNNLALVLELMGEFEAMERSYLKAIELEPHEANFYSNFATSLIGLGHISRAKELLEKSIELDDTLFAAWGNLGRVLCELNEFELSRKAYETALRLGADAAQTRMALAATQIANSEIDAELLFRYHVEAGQELAAEAKALPLDKKEIRQRVESRGTLRVGFCSADFKTHSVAYFLRPLLESIDRSRFEIYCYSSVPRPDEVTAAFRELADAWRHVAKAPVDSVKQLVIEDEIDVLFDLSGNTAGNSLPVFAGRPAPVQVNWLGYAHSTGLPEMHYRIVDKDTDPPGLTLNSEELIYLPGSFICYKAPDAMPDVAKSPHLENGFITFGSFNNITKLSDASIDLFARAMNAVEGSRLVLKSHQSADQTVRDRILCSFSDQGISSDRIQLLPRMKSISDHFECYGQVDIALDTYPYNGTTTTCEALWMGVPVVSLAGDRHASRVGCSALRSVGLADCIAGNADEFAAVASRLACDSDRLVELRASLRESARKSPLGDVARHAESIQNAIEAMWGRFANDE